MFFYLTIAFLFSKTWFYKLCDTTRFYGTKSFTFATLDKDANEELTSSCITVGRSARNMTQFVESSNKFVTLSSIVTATASGL